MKTLPAFATSLSLALLGACATPSPSGPYVVATLMPTRDSSTAARTLIDQNFTFKRASQKPPLAPKGPPPLG